MYKVSIVDYELCNMFSVKKAAEHAGFDAQVTSNAKDILASDVVIIPGVGAFGDGMAAMKRLDLISPIKDAAQSGKLIIGICLGFQILFSESEEFGTHQGLNLIPGVVKRFNNSVSSKDYRVPHIGWNQVYVPSDSNRDRVIDSPVQWKQTPLQGIKNGEYFYFVHSYYAAPEDPNVIMTETNYGHYTFCSSVKWNNIYAFQFHPERSAHQGIHIYDTIEKMIEEQKTTTIKS